MIVLLLTHIAIALSSVIWATFVAVRPSFKKIYASYGLIAATLSTGTVLVVLSSRPILSSCLMGLVYAVGMTIVTIVAHVRIKNIMASERANQE
jgi:hypothetical protein